MKELLLIKIGMAWCYLHISALATTDMMRQTRISDFSFFDIRCYCENCHEKIGLLEQVPIFSYLFFRGKCRHCGERIEATNFILELSLFSVFLLISLILAFNALSVIICFLIYQSVKIALIIKFGRKKEKSFLTFIMSFLMNLFIFALVFLLSLINMSVVGF